MKIAVFTGGFPTEDNPSKSIFNYRAVKSLQEYAKVTVFQFRYWRPKRALKSRSVYNGINVLTLALPWIPVDSAWINALNFWFWSIWSRRLLKKEISNTDIIHTIGIELAPVAASVAMTYRKKHVAQAIGSDVLIYLPRIERYFNLFRWQIGTQCIICNSIFLEQVVNANYPGIRTEVAYRGTNLENFTQSSIAKPHPIQILYLGGFADRKGSGLGRDLKGGETLKKIWQHFDKVQNLEVTLLLGGPESKTEFQENWRKTLKNPERVKLLGVLPPNAIPELMKVASIVVIPSKSEGLPNVAVEASAAGALVLASKVGGIPEIVLHQKTGFVEQPDNIEAWIQRLSEVIENFSEYDRMREAAVLHVRNSFDAKNYASRLINIYETV